MSPLNGKFGATLQVAAAMGPVLLLALIGFLFLNGYLEDPEQKGKRATAISREVLRGHAAEKGHAVILERVDDLDGELDECRAEVKDELKSLNLKLGHVLEAVHAIEISLARTGG